MARAVLRIDIAAKPTWRAGGVSEATLAPQALDADRRHHRGVLRSCQWKPDPQTEEAEARRVLCQCPTTNMHAGSSAAAVEDYRSTSTRGGDVL